MREVGIRFIFRGNRENPLSNALIYDIKRQVARTLENCDFGAVQENGHGVFINEYITPSISQYDPVSDELHICFYLPFPIVENHGDLWRLQSEGVPALHNFIENLYGTLAFSTFIF